MSEWVDVHIATIMRNTNDSQGKTIYGLAHYLYQMLENQKTMIELLDSIEKTVRI